VPLPPAARALIELVEGWRYEQLTMHVESWAFHASRAHGRLFSRREAAQAWYREEYEPIADFLEETGFGGPGTQTARYLRIVKLRNLLVHDRGWGEEVIDQLVEATRKPPPDQADERLRRILKELRRSQPQIGALDGTRRRTRRPVPLRTPARYGRDRTDPRAMRRRVTPLAVRLEGRLYARTRVRRRSGPRRWW
jgi:hypothetical protein